MSSTDHLALSSLKYDEQAEPLLPVTNPAEMMRRLNEWRRYVSEAMERDRHYGKVPGIEKDILFKAGAEDLCIYYGLSPVAEIISEVEDWANQFLQYKVRVTLLSYRTGKVRGTGIGACNSRESKYGYRWLYSSEVPDDVPKASMKTKQIRTKDGRDVKLYRWLNDDVASLQNTILKMAKKRALVDAVLTTTGASVMFTQDMEDFMEDFHEKSEPQAVPAKPTKAPVVFTTPANRQQTSGEEKVAEAASNEINSQSAGGWGLRIREIATPNQASELLADAAKERKENLLSSAEFMRIQGLIYEARKGLG